MMSQTKSPRSLEKQAENERKKIAKATQLIDKAEITTNERGSDIASSFDLLKTFSNSLQSVVGKSQIYS